MNRQTDAAFTDSAMESISTPDTVTITPRMPTLNFRHTPQIWLKDAVRSHFFNALSIYVPYSEKVVMDILRSERENIHNRQLRHQIDSTIRQEGRHARLHRETNQWLERRYPLLRPLVRIQKLTYRGLRKALPEPSTPAAFEHFTSALAKVYLSDRAFWIPEEPNDAVTFLDWHALEELEHQAVCLDLLHARRPGTRWLLPAVILLIWLPLTLLTLITTWFILLFCDRLLLKKSTWRSVVDVLGQTVPAMSSGIFRYRHRNHDVWDKTSMALYQTHAPVISKNAQ